MAATSHVRLGHNLALCILAAFGFAASVTLVTRGRRRKPERERGERAAPGISSPGKTLLPGLAEQEAAKLPYPPNALPGSRSVETPYGTIQVFEWGPEEGERVLLMHGISTPCLALGDMARGFVASGYRVMLFDFFGRGYSDAPTDVAYDIRLYTTQILLVLASSSLSWTGDQSFHLVGYSLGGGVAASFATYYPRMLCSLTLVAGGGIIRRSHIGWRSRLLYSSGILPDRLLETLVRARLRPAPPESSRAHEEPASDPPMTEEQLVLDITGSTSRPQQVEGEAVCGPTSTQGNSDATGGDSFDNAVISAGPSGTTVASVMAWQLRHHQGFVHAFMSSIRHAPIYERREDWGRLGALLAERRWAGVDAEAGLVGGKVLLVLGASDPVVVQEEVISDARELLGEEALETVFLDAGHEIAIVKGDEVARAAIRFWRRMKS